MKELEKEILNIITKSSLWNLGKNSHNALSELTIAIATHIERKYVRKDKCPPHEFKKSGYDSRDKYNVEDYKWIHCDFNWMIDVKFGKNTPPMGNKIELKPCPFCGGKAKLTHDTDGMEIFFIECDQCQVCPKTGDFTELKQAIKAWNRRANE